MLNTLNRRQDYKSSGQHRVTKFMPRFDGPYLVTNSFPEVSTVTLDISHAPNLFPTFHTHLTSNPSLPTTIQSFHHEHLIDQALLRLPLMVHQSISWRKLSTTRVQNTVISNISLGGLVTAPKMTSGFPLATWRIMRLSTITWLPILIFHFDFLFACGMLFPIRFLTQSCTDLLN